MTSIKPLSGLDATFLYAETPSTPMNVIATLVVEGRLGFEEVVERVDARLAPLPQFRRRLLEAPLGLDHPVWVEVADLDVREHVICVPAPPPGDERALEAVVSQVARRRLDRDRPLWEVVVVQGLEGDRTALVVKAHHAAVDGVSGAAVLVNLFDRPGGEDEARVRQPRRSAPTPGTVERLGHELARLRERSGACWDAAQRAGQAVRQLASGYLAPDAPDGAPLPFQAPDAPWNGPLSSRRSVAYARVPFDTLRRIRGAFGGTVNDVVLAACTRALQGELRERGAATDAPLVAAVPVSTRRLGDPADCGNRISVFLAKLPVDREDPLHQLGDVQRSTRQAKRFHASFGHDTLASLAELCAPAPARRLFELYGRWKLASLHRPLVNLVVSNVPGPPTTLSLAGRRVQALHPHGPLMEGVGLNVTVMSYAGSLDVGVLACRERVPEAHRIADRVAESVEELAKLADQARPDFPPLALRVA